MASFHAKIGWKRLRKIEKKKLSLRFVFTRTVIENSKKIAKKFKKLKKFLYDFISSQNRMEKAEKEREQKLSFRFVLTRLVIENSKTIAKKFKKFLYGFISSQNRMEKAEKERKQNYRYVSSLPEP